MARDGRSRLAAATAALALAAGLALAGHPTAAWAWGASGHRILSQLAAERLPEEIPAFLRSAEAARQIGELGREPDRSKGAGKPHDAARDPGHWINLDDAGTVLGAVSLERLPETREAYDDALRAKHTSLFVAGYLPYSMMEGWQQLAKDFAYWRADDWGERGGATPEQRAWFAQDRALRELLTLRDLGVWSHYVGDASQPLHVSQHYNGWGPFANPAGYTTSTRFHAFFEGAFVRQHVDAAAVAARIAPLQDCGCAVAEHVARMLRATLEQVPRLYRLEREGAFAAHPEVGAAFAAERLAFGAGQLRDFVVEAWHASLEQSVGFPPVRVRDVLSGKTNPYATMRALD